MVPEKSQAKFCAFQMFRYQGLIKFKTDFHSRHCFENKTKTRFHWQFRFLFDSTRLKKYALNFCNFYLWFKSLYFVMALQQVKLSYLVLFKESLFLIVWFPFRCCWYVHKHIFVLYFILCCIYIYLYLNVDLHLTLTIRNCHFAFFVTYWIIIHCLLVEFETTIYLGSLMWFCIQSYNVLKNT